MYIAMSIVIQLCPYFLFFFKQKTAYEMRISDWSSDVCSSDLGEPLRIGRYDAGDLDAGDVRIVFRPGQPGGAAPGDNDHKRGEGDEGEIGRASCRERVCQYV